MFPLFSPPMICHICLLNTDSSKVKKKKKGLAFIFFFNISGAIKVIMMLFSSADILLVSFTAEAKCQVQLGTTGKGC